MGFTVDLLSGIAEYLATSDVAVWRPDGTYVDGETAITLSTIPQTPERVVCLSAYAVAEDPVLSDVLVGVQVRCRAGRDPREVTDLSDAVFDVLHGATALRLGGVAVVQIYRQSSTPLGPDSNRRHERADSYHVQAARPTSRSRD